MAAPKPLKLVLAACAAWLLAYELRLVLVPGFEPGAGGILFHRFAHDFVLAAAALVCLARVPARVRSSHERFDGAGYPDALAGDRIPVGARIVAVADAFAAMTAGRPYRAARSPEDALAELRREAGAQFDPAVVDAWCAAHERRGLPAAA